MRLVIQRVSKASVFVGRKVVGKINMGLFILVGIGQEDNEEKVDEVVEKVSKLRIMTDEKGKMNRSILDVGGEILIVSQFTLYSDISKGNRPSFINAARPKEAKKLYEYFVNGLKKKGTNVETGSFGEYMDIDARLDGPVTIVVNK